VYAKENGLLDDARTEFRAALAADPSHEASHEALGDVRSGEKWLAHDEAMTEKGLVLRDGKWLLREEAAILDLPAAEKARRVEQAKADEAPQDVRHVRARRAQVRRGLALGRGRQVQARSLSVGAALEERRRSRLLRERTRPPEGPPRSASAHLAHAPRHRRDGPFRVARRREVDRRPEPSRAARQRDVVLERQVRMHAAEAVGNAAVPIGVKYLVYRFEAHGGGAPRTYFSSIQPDQLHPGLRRGGRADGVHRRPDRRHDPGGVVLDAQVVATSAVGEFTSARSSTPR